MDTSPSRPLDAATPSPPSLDRALELVRFLRAHCPWDAEQTPESLIPYLLEESHEVVDAIRAGDGDELEGELGDLLLNLAFQVVIGEEREQLSAESVTARLEDKMRRRHPHLYGLGEKAEWEEVKAQERGEEPGVLSGLARHLDPLTKAHRIQVRVSDVGFDWSDFRGALDKVVEELDEVREALDEGRSPEVVCEELGDLLFAVVNLSRLAGPHPAEALDQANRKFIRRFQQLEELARQRDIDTRTAGLEALDELWDEVKAGEATE